MHYRGVLALAAASASVWAASGASGSTVTGQPIVDRGLAKEIAQAVDSTRQARGFRPLHWNSELAAVAMKHSTEMVVFGFFSHSSQGGISVTARLKAAYKPRGRGPWEVGENLFYAIPNATAKDVIRAWLESPPHRANLLNSNWRDLGISVVRADKGVGKFSGQPVVVVTADFGLRG
jgi:uncharacterized protein YkwD